MSADFQCQCQAAGWCETLKRYQIERNLQICQGKVLTPEKCAGYRRNWLALSATNPPRNEPAEPRLVPCLHQGEKIDSQICSSCAGKVTIAIFACPLLERCTVGAKNGKGRLEGIACCADCDRYATAADPPPAG